jgi:hypothetical protein
MKQFAMTLALLPLMAYGATFLDVTPTDVSKNDVPDRMIVLGNDTTNGFQVFPFTSINSLWCRPEGSIDVSHVRISDNVLFTSTVDANPADLEAACQAWLDYLNGSGPLPPINP